MTAVGLGPSYGGMLPVWCVLRCPLVSNLSGKLAAQEAKHATALLGEWSPIDTTEALLLLSSSFQYCL